MSREGDRRLRGDEARQWVKENPDLAATGVSHKGNMTGDWCQESSGDYSPCTRSPNHKGPHICFHNWGSYDPEANGDIVMWFTT